MLQRLPFSSPLHTYSSSELVELSRKVELIELITEVGLVELIELITLVELGEQIELVALVKCNSSMTENNKDKSVAIK